MLVGTRRQPWGLTGISAGCLTEDEASAWADRARTSKTGASDGNPICSHALVGPGATLVTRKVEKAQK